MFFRVVTKASNSAPNCRLGILIFNFLLLSTFFDRFLVSIHLSLHRSTQSKTGLLSGGSSRLPHNRTHLTRTDIDHHFYAFAACAWCSIKLVAVPSQTSTTVNTSAIATTISFSTFLAINANLHPLTTLLQRVVRDRARAGIATVFL